MTSYPGKQTAAIHILPNIWRRKGNQTMKFVQLIKYSIRNIFLNHTKKCCGETIPCLWINGIKFNIVFVSCMSS